MPKWVQLKKYILVKDNTEQIEGKMEMEGDRYLQKYVREAVITAEIRETGEHGSDSSAEIHDAGKCIAVDSRPKMEVCCWCPSNNKL